MPAEFLCNLPKNLTTHLTHKLYSVFPKEVLRREFAKEKTEVADTLPILYLLKDNTYSVTPLDACTYGYETKMVMAK